MDRKARLLEQIEELVLCGMVEGESILTLYHLFKSYEQGCISAEEMQYEINSFNPESYSEVPRDE